MKAPAATAGDPAPTWSALLLALWKHTALEVYPEMEAAMMEISVFFFFIEFRVQVLFSLSPGVHFLPSCRAPLWGFSYAFGHLTINVCLYTALISLPFDNTDSIMNRSCAHKAM